MEHGVVENDTCHLLAVSYDRIDRSTAACPLYQVDVVRFLSGYCFVIDNPALLIPAGYPDNAVTTCVFKLDPIFLLTIKTNSIPVYITLIGYEHSFPAAYQHYMKLIWNTFWFYIIMVYDQRVNGPFKFGWCLLLMYPRDHETMPSTNPHAI